MCVPEKELVSVCMYEGLGERLLVGEGLRVRVEADADKVGVGTVVRLEVRLVVSVAEGVDVLHKAHNT